jgi:hypothetical protein
MAKTKTPLRDRLKKKKKELKERTSGKSHIIFQKEGDLRVRLLPTGDDNDFVFEVTSFYLGPNIKGIFSPVTFGEPCAIMEKYEELKESDDPEDNELAKKFVPKKRYLAPVVVYQDTKGKKVDEENSGKLVQLSNNQYQEIIDLYLDNDEWGDMTQVDENGYDIKLSRIGTGQYDTEYSILPFKNTPCPAKYAKPIDLEGMVRGVVATYEETLAAINEFLNMGDEDDEDEKPKKTVKKKIIKKKSKKA